MYYYQAGRGLCRVLVTTLQWLSLQLHIQGLYRSGHVSCSVLPVLAVLRVMQTDMKGAVSGSCLLNDSSVHTAESFELCKPQLQLLM
jgi:hypothetical protein